MGRHYFTPLDVLRQELVGFTYSNEVLDEIAGIDMRHLATPDSFASVRCLHTDVQADRQPAVADRAAEDTAVFADRLDVDCGWYDSTRVTAAITDKKITRRLVELLLAETHG